jgi:hypothetical protein
LVAEPSRTEPSPVFVAGDAMPTSACFAVNPGALAESNPAAVGGSEQTSEPYTLPSSLSDLAAPAAKPSRIAHFSSDFVYLQNHGALQSLKSARNRYDFSL